MFRLYSKRTCVSWPSTLVQQHYFSTVSQVKWNIYKPKIQDSKSRDSTKARKVNLSKKLRSEFEKYKGKTPIIQCKRKEFNFYEGMKYGKFEVVPLASKAWHKRGSNGDFFSLYEDYMLPNEYHFNHIPLPKQSSDTNETNVMSPFAVLGIQDDLISTLEGIGVTKPADIQIAAIPHILLGKNCVVSAHTGCGKTLAYLLPLIQLLLRDIKKEGDINIPHSSPKALILTPSRELAKQIYVLLQKLVPGSQIRSRLVVGQYDSSVEDMPEVVDVLIGSLGSVRKKIYRGAIKLERVQHIVLDEADQLVDDQNRPLIRAILKKVHFKQQPEENAQQSVKGAQLTLVSATLPTNLRSLFEDIVEVDSLQTVCTSFLHDVMKSAPQLFLKVGKIHKGKALIDLVEKDHKHKTPVLIFSNTVKTADWVSLQLNDCGFLCRNLTSNVPTQIRHHLFEKFQQGEFNILSTTPMVARGLDTVRVKHIINFDFPLYVSEYIHQIGRVGRIGSPKHCSITNIIAHSREIDLVQKIELSIRLNEKLTAVNANIPGILRQRRERYGDNEDDDDDDDDDKGEEENKIE